MRVIAGKFKGHRLNCPTGRDVRPTLDRVKEAIFSKISYLLDDALVLDLFAGCGNLGVESLSRGAKKISFCESDKRHVNAIKDNVRNLKIDKNEVEFKGEVFRALEKFKDEEKKFDLIFADPPYKQFYEGRTKLPEKMLIVNYLMEHGELEKLMHENSVLIVEHQKDIILPEKINNIICYDTKHYGSVAVSFYELSS